MADNLLQKDTCKYDFCVGTEIGASLQKVKFWKYFKKQFQLRKTTTITGTTTKTKQETFKETKEQEIFVQSNFRRIPKNYERRDRE